MTRRYGNKARTKADKRAAALQFVILSDKPASDKVRSLVASYGFTQPQAEAFVKEHAA